MSNRNNLPKPYVDCLLLHRDGSQRIGRLNHNSTHFQLASYQTRKTEVVWAPGDVILWREIEPFNVGDNGGAT
ncbi:hypothetical protein [Aeromonas media]|uniref:hypothetical protein n=1 Tax=Aeromonas media TaxID=651 RepID=UPI0038D03DF2